MKFLFDWCHLLHDGDWDCKLGLDWYRFNPVIGARKDLRGSKGASLIVYLIRWRLSFTWIKDYKSYLARINYRHKDTLTRIAELQKKKELKKNK
jgi:hypothetical protein